MEKRPVISVPLSNNEKWLEKASLVLLILIIISIPIYWAALPNRIPTHFGFSGQPDGWGAKSSILSLPIIGIVMYLMLSIVSKYPQIYNYPVKITQENAQRLYKIGVNMMRVLKFEVMLIFAVIHIQTIKAAINPHITLGPFIMLPLVFLPLASTAVFIYRFYKEK